MGDTFDLSLGGDGGDGYVIKNIGGVRFVYGMVPLSDMAMLSHGYSDQAVMSLELASLTGATLVVGEPEDVERVRHSPLPISEVRENESLAARRAGLHDLANWLRLGERGLSSLTISAKLFGHPVLHTSINYPRDPSDLRRCLLLLDATDSHRRIGEMASVSDEWARLVAEWDSIVAVFAEEAGGNSCPRTYALMKKALSE